jgi:hypothetical protein
VISRSVIPPGSDWPSRAIAWLIMTKRRLASSAQDSAFSVNAGNVARSAAGNSCPTASCVFWRSGAGAAGTAGRPGSDHGCALAATGSGETDADGVTATIAAGLSLNHQNAPPTSNTANSVGTPTRSKKPRRAPETGVPLSSVGI